MLYPLKFAPALKFYPYGGRRFVEVLELDLPRDRDIAESWEIADRGDDQSTGRQWPFGRTDGARPDGQLRCRIGRRRSSCALWRILSVADQIPRLRQAFARAHAPVRRRRRSRLGMKDCGKSEAWYMVRSDAGAFAYCGAKPGLTPEKFAQAIADGDTLTTR